MSKLSRYNLLISVICSKLRCLHSLGSSDHSIDHNRLITTRSLEAWIFLADDLMCKNGLSEQSRDVRITNLITYLNSHHIALTLKILKKTYDLLIDHISHKNRLTDLACFKGRLGESEGSLLGSLFSPIKESLLSVITSNTLVSNGVFLSVSTSDMWICAHYLQFLNKLNYQDIGLESKALLEYVDCEAEVASYDISRCDRYQTAIRTILHEWMKDWDYDGGRPKHGSGSVADSTGDKLSKYYAMASDSRIHYLYKDDELLTVLPYWRRQTFSRCSKLVFVPKNITKLRSISMEPAVLQYLQQGCMESIYKYIDSHHYLSKILKLSDQTQNKSFAYHGSITNEYATIDLSHASDSVNWKLVKRLFGRTPKLLKWLICTRSTHTKLPTGEIIRLDKFAPMGSALCFPIESLLFAAIAELSIRLSREQGADRNVLTGIRSSIRKYTVYGDDIIIPSYAADTCIMLLETFGFTPNNEKSYLDGPFKESCGGNYYCGKDITAIKYAPKFDLSYKNGISPLAYTALCSYANLAYERGLLLLRLYIIRLLLRSGLKPLFSDSLDESPAIYSSQPTNFHLKVRYSRRYQKSQYVYTGIKAANYKKLSPEDIDEDIYLFDKLLVISKRDEESNFPLLNARLHGHVLTFDINAPFSRETLNEQAVMYTLCFKDV